MDEERVTSAVYLRVMGLSVTLRRTRCMGCRRSILGGEYRMAFPSMRSMGKALRFQKNIMRYVCLSCAKADLEEAIKTARTFRKKVIRKLQTDKAYYATRALGEEFQAQAASMVKWRVDKVMVRRYNTRKRMMKRAKEIEVAVAGHRVAARTALDAAASEEDKTCS